MPAIFAEELNTSEVDPQPCIDLLRTCRAVEPIDHWPPVHELQGALCGRVNGYRARTCVWKDADNRLIAFASLFADSVLVFCIHPRWHGDAEIEMQIIRWGMARAQAIAQANGEYVTLCIPVCDDQAQTTALLEGQGFVPEAWYTVRMLRSLDDPIPDPQMTSGFTLQYGVDEPDLERYVALYRTTFGASAMSAKDHLARMQDTAYVVDLDILAIAPDGTLAAFCCCSISPEEDARWGHKEGWVDLLGTHPAFRRQGLGRMVLQAGLRRLKAHGRDVALAGIGSWNIAAQRLCASIGFRTIHQIRVYTWQAAEERSCMARGVSLC